MIERRTTRALSLRGIWVFLHVPDKPIDLGHVARLDHDQTNSAFIENLEKTFINPGHVFLFRAGLDCSHGNRKAAM